MQFIKFGLYWLYVCAKYAKSIFVFGKKWYYVFLIIIGWVWNDLWLYKFSIYICLCLYQVCKRIIFKTTHMLQKSLSKLSVMKRFTEKYYQ